MYKGQFWHNSYQFDGTTIRLLVTDDPEKELVFIDKKFVMIKENNQKFKTKGTFQIK